MKKFRKNMEGFTLIELLIVIAILATLAIVVLLALDPVQQLARTRDSGRSSTVAQLGHAMEAYGTVRNGYYPTLTEAGTTWLQTLLVDSGEIKTFPNNPGYPTLDSVPGCAAGDASDNNGGDSSPICYDGNEDAFVIYIQAEAKSNTSQCGTDTAYFVYSSGLGRGGLWCGAAAPGPGVTSGFTDQ